MNDRLKVLILDDNQACIDQLKHLLAAFPYVEFVVELTDSSQYMEYMRAYPIDLIFLDIRIGKESGFSIAEFTKRNFPERMIIFMTGFEDFAIQGYVYEPIDFLAKPINILRLEKALVRALEKKKKLTPKSKAKIGIYCNGSFNFVEVAQILFVEKKGRKAEIVCLNGNSMLLYTTRESMNSLEKIFADYNFARVHQSYLVPLSRIRTISQVDTGSSYELEIDSYSKKIPVSRKKYGELLNQLKEIGITLV